MSIRQVVNKLRNIILGTYYNLFNKQQQVAFKRRKICNSCPHKTKLGKLGYICTKCGCIIESKIRVSSEHCYLNKW